MGFRELPPDHMVLLNLYLEECETRGRELTLEEALKLCEPHTGKADLFARVDFVQVGARCRLCVREGWDRGPDGIFVKKTAAAL